MNGSLRVGVARLGRLNVRELARDAEGRPFEGEAVAIYYDADLIRHVFPGFHEAKLLVRFAVPSLGVVLGRWYRVEHLCTERKKGDGNICTRPDPAPGSDLVREARLALGRQILADEDLDPIAIFGPDKAFRVLIETAGKRKDAPVSSGGPYSRIARLLERLDGNDQAGREIRPVPGVRCPVPGAPYPVPAAENENENENENGESLTRRRDISRGDPEPVLELPDLEPEVDDALEAIPIAVDPEIATPSSEPVAPLPETLTPSEVGFRAALAALEADLARDRKERDR